jgi:hypothetical protein
MKDYKEIEAQAQTFEKIADISQVEEPELHQLGLEAEQYLSRHNWCKDVVDGWLAVYWEEILAVFLFQIDPLNEEVDHYVWIVVGDIPSAYIDVESGKDPKEVLEGYVDIMTDWIDNVMAGRSVVESYPLEVPATPEYATMLKNKLIILKDFIEQEFN